LRRTRHAERIERRHALQIAVAALTAATLPCAPRWAGAATTVTPSMSPERALARLMDGNASFVTGTLNGGRAVAERRADVAGGQRPFAMVLACADSRVPPEHVFDQSVGDLFVCRVAGNVLEPGTLGSFEYAISYIGSPAVLVVLGHERCGAVIDLVELVKSGRPAGSSIQVIVDAIRPAVNGTPRGRLSDAAYIEAIVRSNARMTARAVTLRSAIVRGAVERHHLKVVPAYYALESGRVTLL
jgi:carbonic anhydrase